MYLTCQVTVNVDHAVMNNREMMMSRVLRGRKWMTSGGTTIYDRLPRNQRRKPSKQIAIRDAFSLPRNQSINTWRNVSLWNGWLEPDRIVNKNYF